MANDFIFIFSKRRNLQLPNDLTRRYVMRFDSKKRAFLYKTSEAQTLYIYYINKLTCRTLLYDLWDDNKQITRLNYYIYYFSGIINSRSIFSNVYYIFNVITRRKLQILLIINDGTYSNFYWNWCENENIIHPSFLFLN
jgi:hypothetical protein